MRILVVEDDTNLNRQLKDALTDAGYVVDVAFDGEEGHFLGDTEPYDAIVLDIGLPQMDGLSVLEAWRRDGRNTPVLLLTARDRWSDKVQGIDAGADEDDESAYKAPAYYLEDHSQDPAQLVEADNYEQDANSRLANAMADLDDRSRTILQQRWLSEEKATLHELADMYKVSAERIRQLEKNAMKRLKNAIGTDLVLA